MARSASLTLWDHFKAGLADDPNDAGKQMNEGTITSGEVFGSREVLTAAYRRSVENWRKTKTASARGPRSASVPFP